MIKGSGYLVKCKCSEKNSYRLSPLLGHIEKETK